MNTIDQNHQKNSKNRCNYPSFDEKESPAAAVASAWICVKSNEKYRDFCFEVGVLDSPFSSGLMTAISARRNREKSLESEEFRIYQINPIEGVCYLSKLSKQILHEVRRNQIGTVVLVLLALRSLCELDLPRVSSSLFLQ
jgi:hypothetical protein